MKKTIKWYSVAQYGTEREFIHPEHKADAAIIQQLTGQKTINSAVRELLRDLTGCAIDFEQVLPPSRKAPPSAQSVSMKQNSMPGTFCANCGSEAQLDSFCLCAKCA